MEVVRLCRCCKVIILVCCDFAILPHLVVDGMSSSAPRRISEQHDRWGSIIVILSPCFYAVVVVVALPGGLLSGRAENVLKSRPLDIGGEGDNPRY